VGELVVIQKDQLQKLLEEVVVNALTKQQQQKFKNLQHLSVADAATYTNRKISYIRSLIYQKKLQKIKKGKSVYLQKKELDRYKIK
jgi:excisionase family DNA binding protein